MPQRGVAEKEERPCAGCFGRAFGKRAAQKSMRMGRGAGAARQTQRQEQSRLCGIVLKKRGDTSGFVPLFFVFGEKDGFDLRGQLTKRRIACAHMLAQKLGGGQRASLFIRRVLNLRQGNTEGLHTARCFIRFEIAEHTSGARAEHG